VIVAKDGYRPLARNVKISRENAITADFALKAV
jgi:hypothetical protein